MRISAPSHWSAHHLAHNGLDPHHFECFEEHAS